MLAVEKGKKGVINRNQITWDRYSEPHGVGISYPVKDQGYHMLAPENVFGIAAARDGGDLASGKESEVAL